MGLGLLHYSAAMAVTSLIVAIAALVASAATALYARQQAVAAQASAAAAQDSVGAARDSAKAAQDSARAAEVVTAIEQQRQRESLRPDLALSCAVPPGAASYNAVLTVELTGPPALHGLEAVTIRIRDDVPDRKPPPGSQLTEEQFSKVIWGPYRFNPAQDMTDTYGRSHGPFVLPQNEQYTISLLESVEPSWSHTNWRQQWDGKPVRLEIKCWSHNDEHWTLTREVEVQYEPNRFM